MDIFEFWGDVIVHRTLQFVDIGLAKRYKAESNDELHALLNGHFKGDDFRFGQDEKKACSRVRGSGNEDGYESAAASRMFALNLPGHETHAVASFARVLYQRYPMKVLFHGKGLHDLFKSAVDAPYERQFLHQLIVVTDEPLPEIVCREDPDGQDEKDKGENAHARKPETDELSRQITQEIVYQAQQARKNIIRGPDRYDNEQTRDKIFFTEILDFFHEVNITDFILRLQAFFRKQHRIAVLKQSEEGFENGADSVVHKIPACVTP
jgi:hypothetical protein